MSKEKMLSTIKATLKWNGTTIVAVASTPDNVNQRPQAVKIHMQHGGGYYASFFYDAYRYYAQHIKLGEEFTAKKTNDYQYHGGASHATQIRLDKVNRNKRNRHAKSLY